MEPIASHLPDPDSPQPTASSQTSSAPNPNTATPGRMSSPPTTPSQARPSGSLADFVWLHMAALYGHTWTSAYGDSSRGPAGAQWAKTLAGMTRAQIEAGIDACRAEGAEWPPSAPRFRAMCLGIPSLARVRLELTRGQPSPFARMVWANLDVHRYRTESADRADRMLREAYDLAREDVMQGAELPPEPVAAMTDDTRREPVPADPETAKARMAEIAELLGVNHSPEYLAKVEGYMAEFGCSRAQAEAIVEGGTGEAESAGEVGHAF